MEKETEGKIDEFFKAFASSPYTYSPTFAVID
jgi:hypothetical protein